MKIRTDFVTNSSSSSFVAITVSANTLDRYLQKQEQEGIFKRIGWLYNDGNAVDMELDRSFAKSLAAILGKTVEDMENDPDIEYDIGADEETLTALIEFINQNAAAIDAEASGDIEIVYEDSEVGYAYAQSLSYKDHHGRLAKWPNAHGWNMGKGGGYEKIMEYSRRFVNGEIPELVGTGCNTLGEIAFDKDILTAAEEKTGITETFDVEEIAKKTLSAPEKKRKQEDAKQTIHVPKTIKECCKLFDCFVSDNLITINGVKKSFSEVIIPGTVEGISVEIAQGAFNRNKKLEKLVLSEGVVAIGADAFNDCKQLQKVVFASTIRRIGSGVFDGTPWIRSRGDMLIVNDILVKYHGSASEVRIPEGVKRINEYSFAYTHGLQSVVIPDSVEYIGDSAFYCSDLIDVQFPEHDVRFGENPFDSTPWNDAHPDWVVVNGTLLGISKSYYYSVMMDSDSISIPEGITTIGHNAFKYGIWRWDQIRSIRLPEGLREIGDCEFAGFSGVKEAELPSTLVRIGNRAFEQCSALEKINFPEGLETIGAGAFSNNNRLEEILLPDTVKTIGDRAFANCELLKRIKLPKHLENIPRSLVSQCAKLETVEMPKVCSRIENDAFVGCLKLTQLRLPETLRELGAAAFCGCTALSEITIPEGVTEIPYDLLSYCTSLAAVKLPQSVQSIQESAFSECPDLTVFAPSGSYAERFAKEKNIPFTAE